ncbi:hypothetical protein SFRURICE_020916, partial [Spodoptera frugiperda]
NINIICYTWCKSCGPSITACLVADDDAKSAERSVAENNSAITHDDVLYLSNSRSVFDNFVSTQDDFTAKIATIPVTRWVNSTIVVLLTRFYSCCVTALGTCIGGSLSRSTRMSAESIVVVVGDSEETLLLSAVTQDNDLYLSNSRSVLDNLVSTQDDFTAKIATIPVTRWVNSTIVVLLPVARRESSTISLIFDSNCDASVIRLYRKPHRPTSDTQDEGTADVGWQSLLQSTARQGDDVVYMEFRIFSGVSPPRSCGPSISGCLVADDDAKSAERSVVG